MPTITCVCDCRTSHGEGPVWDEEEQALYWVDMVGTPAVHRWTPATNQHDHWPMPEPIGFLYRRKSGPGWVAGFQNGLAILTLEPEIKIDFFDDPEPHLPNNRFNDAKCDSKGRLWAGTIP